MNRFLPPAAAALLLALRPASAQLDAPVLEIAWPAGEPLVLDWAPVAGASCYEIQLAPDCGAFRPFGRIDAPGLVFDPQLPDWGEGARRCWRVVALDGCDPPADPPEDVLAWYRLDGNGLDASGHGFHLGGAPDAWVPGRFGTAARFDGVAARLERSAGSGLHPGAEGWTVSAWVASPALPLQGAVVSWYRCGANPNCYTADAAAYRLTASQGKPTWYVRSDQNVHETLGDLAIDDLRWHHLAGTLDGVDRRLRLYVDGALAEEGLLEIGALSSGQVAVPFSLGRIWRTGWGQPNAYLSGDLDDVRLYARALSPGEVRALYHEGGWPFESE